MEIFDRLKILRSNTKVDSNTNCLCNQISRSGYASIEMKLTGLTPRNLSLQSCEHIFRKSQVA